MLMQERRLEILNILNREGIVKTQDLMEHFDASESTIRRDLSEMEEEGQLTRVHGGAQKLDLYDLERAIEKKRIENVDEKRLIAREAAKKVYNNDIVFLDSSTTTAEMVPFLVNKDLVVVTNSPEIAVDLMTNEISTILLGGRIRQATHAIVDSVAYAQLSTCFFNKVFLGMNGVHPDFGYSTPDPEEALIKEYALEHCTAAYVLADETKINRITFTQVAKIRSIPLITCCEDPQKIERLAAMTEVTNVYPKNDLR